MQLRLLSQSLSQQTWFLRLSNLLLLCSLLTITVQARQQPTSYCKCICFTNSTIIPLNSPPPASSSSPAAASAALFPRTPEDGNSEEDNGNGADGSNRHRQLTCSDCNRAFCLDYNLPICKNAKEEDVFTQCFQRDSLKDETVVVLFLFSTTGLLGWAILKPWIDKMRDSETAQRYTSASGSAASQGLPTVSSMGRRTRGGMSGMNGARGDYNEEQERRGGRSGRPAANSISRQGGLNS